MAVFRTARKVWREDSGAALAEFALISVLLLLLLFAVLQVALYFYVRNVVAASAADGARYAAAAGAADSAGGVRASTMVASGLNSSIARDVPCAGAGGVDSESGLPIVVVHCTGHIRSVFLPVGSMLTIDVTARSLKEGR